MSKEKCILIEELAWKDARNDVLNSSRELTTIIDDLSPGKDFPLFKVKYPFGAVIAANSHFCFPTEPSLHHTVASNAIKSKLSYGTMPLGIITKNTVEFFFDTSRKIFSLATAGHGLKIGVCEYLGWRNQCSIVAGGRSLYMLPKISETLAHKQLRKKYNVIEFPPKSLYDHWKVFTQITRSQEFNSEWFCEIIFLSTEWVAKMKKDPAWSKLDMYVHKQGWRHSLYARKKVSLDIVWEHFVRSLSNRDHKVDPHVIDTLKHIIYIITGTIPASAPTNGENTMGPLQELQLIYEDPKGYGLDEYLATIMQPQYFSLKKPSPVYYSLQLPNIFESLPRTKKITSVIDNVRDLGELLDRFLNKKWEEAPWMNIITNNITLGSMLANVQLDYFHGDMFAYGNLIKSSAKMPEYDSRLFYSPLKNRKRTFASSSTFLRGCVMITAKPLP